MEREKIKKMSKRLAVIEQEKLQKTFIGNEKGTNSKLSLRLNVMKNGTNRKMSYHLYVMKNKINRKKL